MSGLEIALVAGIASAVVGAVGTVSSGLAAKAQADTEAKVLRQQADYQRQGAEAEAKDFRERQSRLMAARRALLGGTGVDPGQGSPLFVTEDMAGEIELQALRIRHGGEVNATRLEQQAMLQRMAGGAAATGGWVRGGSLLLTGVTSAYGSYINPSGYTKDDDE